MDFWIGPAGDEREDVDLLENKSWSEGFLLRIFFAFNEAFSMVGDGELSSGAAALAALPNFGSTHRGDGEKVGMDRSAKERLFSTSVR